MKTNSGQTIDKQRQRSIKVSETCFTAIRRKKIFLSYPWYILKNRRRLFTMQIGNCFFSHVEKDASIILPVTENNKTSKHAP